MIKHNVSRMSASKLSQVTVEIDVGSKVGWLRRLRRVVDHTRGRVALIVILLLYTAGGAKVFQDMELPREQREYRQFHESLTLLKRRLEEIVAHTHMPTSSRMKQFRTMLDEYEHHLVKAARSGVFFGTGNFSTHVFNWDYMHSLFFASTVLTTIGYGHMAPRSTAGRVFCMLFALVGIPLTISVISDIGSLLASTCTSLYRRVFAAASSGRHRRSRCFRLSDKQERLLAVLVAVSMLLVYIAIGGLLFLLWESWTFIESFYFCFITMTTIGFGDFVPANARYMLLCTAYIFVGLAMTTTIIELVRRQYAQSWQQVKILSTRLQSLSGPLAQHLRRLGEHGQTAVLMDGELLRELKALRHTLASTHVRHDFGLDDSELDALQPAPRVIQIVIYESNV